MEKLDCRKKQTAGVSDGARRRVVAKVQDDAATDLDSPIIGKSLAQGKARKQSKASRKAEKAEAARAAAPTKVEIVEVGKEGMSVADLAANLAVNDGEVVKALFIKGIATVVNQVLDADTVRVVCKEFDVEVVEAGRVEEIAKRKTEFLDENDLEYLEVRPPVVTIMGHVDHGKTSLLDYIRKSKIAAGEAGGITQGIGAYRVLVQVGEEQQECVFLDTPGHQAFSAMRARGARVTDIAVIVVAADDGVRPQTLEAIAHAKVAGVAFVIAINKIDKEGAQSERVMQELSSNGVMVEDWGGDAPSVQVSAKAGTGVESLLETIMLMAEVCASYFWIKAKDDDFELEDDGGFDVTEVGDFDEEEDDFKDYETEYETPIGYSPVQIETDASVKSDGELDANVVDWKIDEDRFHKINLLTCDFFIRKVPDPDNDVYNFREIYVSPPDTDIYSIPKTDGRLPSKPIRCNLSNYEYIHTTEPPVDEPRSPLAKTEYQVMKVFLMRHFKDRRTEDEKFVLDFEEIYVIDSKTRSLLYRANVKVDVPGGKKRDRLTEVLIVRDDGTTFRIIREEDQKSPDQIVQAVHWERSREEIEQFLRGFRDYEVSNWF